MNTHDAIKIIGARQNNLQDIDLGKVRISRSFLPKLTR